MKGISNPTAEIGSFPRRVAWLASDPMSLDEGIGILSCGFGVFERKGIGRSIDLEMGYATGYLNRDVSKNLEK